MLNYIHLIIFEALLLFLLYYDMTTVVDKLLNNDFILH